MKERPILMSAPMVRSTLAGRKFQTRRIMKGQPYTLRTEGWGFPTRKGGFASAKMILDDCPYGKPGDRLWVRETWMGWRRTSYECYDYETMSKEERGGQTINEYAEWYGPENINVAYRADGDDEHWLPAIHMPRWASRITLEITAMRVERLQTISEEDAIAEGIAPLFDEKERLAVGCNLNPMPWNNYLWHGHVGRSIKAKQAAAWPHQYSSYEDPRLSYSSLWESINGPGSWAANPFCWCISFKVL